MKTAVSLPDELFAEAERLAKRLKKSRSELYQLAIAAFVARYDDEVVTRAYDELATELKAEDVAFVRRAARKTAGRVEW